MNPLLTTRDATANSNRPRAWLNIIVFDEQMNIVMTNDGKNSYFEQAGATNVLKVFNITNREITKNGSVALKNHRYKNKMFIFDFENAVSH